MNTLSPWLLALFSTKFLLYIAYAMTIGGLSAHLLMPSYQQQQLALTPYTLTGVIMGLMLAGMEFFLQVGSFSETGLLGVFDITFITILWQSEAGTVLTLRLLAWAAILLMLSVMLAYRLPKHWMAGTALLIAPLIAVSFSLQGHTVAHATWVQIALILHIFIAMWWMGLLYPLSQACLTFDRDDLQQLMHQFGTQAMALVLLLLTAGITISIALTPKLEALLSTSHGNMLLLKLLAVAAILALAAWHKYRFVPRLHIAHAAATLKRSIQVEMGVGLVILSITAALSTLVGPIQD